MVPEAVAGSAPVKQEAAAPAAAPVVEKKTLSVLDMAKAETAKILEAANKAKEAVEAEKPKDAEEPAEPAEEVESVEEEEEDVEAKPDDPDSFKKRVDKLNGKIEAKAKEVEAARVEASNFQRQLSEANERIGAMTEQMEAINDLHLVSQIDPTLKDLVGSHWFFQGRRPTLDDVGGDTAVFEKIQGIIAERQAEAKVKGQTTVAQREVAVTEQMKAYDAEEVSLKASPVYGQFINENDLEKAYDFITEQVKSGNRYFDRLEKVFPVVFGDRVAVALKKAGAEEAVKRIDKARKGTSLKAKGVNAPAAKPDLSKMSPLQQAKYYTGQLGAS